MKRLFSTEDFKKSEASDMLPLECEYCSKQFNAKKHRIIRVESGKLPKYAHRFCSQQCLRECKRKEAEITLNCKNCEIAFTKYRGRVKDTQNAFCCKACAATYNNKHKKFGTRRSKLEEWVEQKLTAQFEFEIHFNRKDAIDSELDIYIPSLKLAFELNGIYHYEPIHGPNILENIQTNDNRKFQACLERGIELCIIDTSKQVYFSERTSQIYLDIICQVINQKWRS